MEESLTGTYYDPGAFKCNYFGQTSHHPSVWIRPPICLPGDSHHTRLPQRWKDDDGSWGAVSTVAQGPHAPFISGPFSWASPLPHAPRPTYPERGHGGQVHLWGAGDYLVSRQDACGKTGFELGARGPLRRQAFPGKRTPVQGPRGERRTAVGVHSFTLPGPAAPLPPPPRAHLRR
jgi:hypothetical protein